MLETTTLGVPFCDLGRKGKIGVQVCFQAPGGPLGVLMQKLGRAGILCSGRGVGGRADGSGRWLQAGQDGELAVCGLLVAWGFSYCGAWALEGWLSHCGAWAWLPCGRWDLPGLGIEPVSPALVGGFLSTVPAGKFLHIHS